jgi:hypothetical protein
MRFTVVPASRTDYSASQATETFIGPARVGPLIRGCDHRPRLAAGGRGNRPDRQAKAGRPAVSAMLSTFFTSLRMPNAEITSVTPRMISQIPTTRANVTIESNG